MHIIIAAGFRTGRALISGFYIQIYTGGGDGIHTDVYNCTHLCGTFRFGAYIGCDRAASRGSLGACVRACVFAVYLNSNHLQCVGMRSRTHKYAL